MPKTTRQANRTVARKPAEARPSTPAPSVTKPKKAEPKASALPTSTVHFHIHAGIPELHGYAQGRGWLANGWTVLSVPWFEIVHTSDHWKTTSHQKSTEPQAADSNGHLTLVGVAPGTEIEFALNIGIACQAPGEGGTVREQGDVWLNNGGQNFRQTTR